MYLVDNIELMLTENLQEEIVALNGFGARTIACTIFFNISMPHFTCGRICFTDDLSLGKSY